MKSRYFLSYARDDGAEACEYFHLSLTNLGNHAYRDVTNNYGGDNWTQKIRSEIQKADAFLLFVTPGAIQSENVEKEWREALLMRKRIVPLLIRTADMPAEILALYHFRDLRERDVFNVEPTKVAQAMDALHDEMEADLKDIQQSMQDVPNPAARKYLDPLFEELDSLFIRPQPARFPPEVFKAFAFLARRLVTALSNGQDMGPELDKMIAGTFESPGWDLQPVYAAWPEAFTRALRRVRDKLPGITVPVVVVAMTKQEVDDLQSGAAFGPWPSQLKNEFDSLAANLPAGWTERYGAQSEDWRPFGPETVSELIRQSFALVEQDKCREPLKASFIDVRTLRGNRKLLRELRSRSCLIVIDCISSRHPVLQSAFRASHLDVSPHSVVVRTLMNNSFATLTQSVEVLVQEWFDCEFYHRSKMDDDPACADVLVWDDFRKLLRNQIPRYLPECAIQQNESWQAMNNVGRPPQ
jgi:hypothetical protein